MSLDMSKVGEWIGPYPHDCTWQDVVLYALGIGTTADEIKYLYEGLGPAVHPTYAVVPSFRAFVAAARSVAPDGTRNIHGEQEITLYRPVPVGERVETRARVVDLFDKGRAAVMRVHTQTENQGGERLFENFYTLFIPGAGGFGGERGPASERIEPPTDRAPDFEISLHTSREQAALYRLCGDANPLHIDPDRATQLGFERPILHGLCTFGIAGRAAVSGACGGDASRLKSLSGRFTGVVYPGDQLLTRGWAVADGRFILQTHAGDDRVVFGSGVAVVE